MPLRERLLIALLVSLAAFGPLSISIFTPSMTDIARSLAASDADVKLTLTTFLLGYAGGQMLFGPLSDRFGRRPVLLAGVALYAATGLACALTTSIGSLIVLRIFHGVGVCSGTVIARAITRDTFGHHGSPKVMGWIALGINVAPAVAPILGGHLTAWFGWQAIFYVLAGFGTLIFFVVLAFLRESNPYRGRSLGVWGTIRQAGPMLRDRLFMGYALAIAAAFGAMFAYSAGAPFVLMSMIGMGPAEYGYWVLTSVAGFTAGSYLATRLIGRVSLARCTLLGLVIGLVGAGAMALLAFMGLLSPWSIVVPYFGIAMGSGTVMAPAMAGSVNRFPRQAGTASSLMGVLQMGGAAVATIFVTVFTDGTQFPMVLTIGGSLVLGLAVATLLLQPRRAVDPASPEMAAEPAAPPTRR
jgi:DHA1 family bicyclomycin/chloramphenicol resistance-like MFS transporter